MLRRIAILLLSFSASTVYAQEQAEHRNFQYQSAIDPLTGRYNFAYDTGNNNDIAHSMHMQYQDADGMVRGRYGYTDPRGKLRMVEYEAGPNGFIARGDVGVDMALHDNAPAVNSERPISSYREGDFLLDPAPVQMAGWNPESNPMGTNIADNPQNTESATSAPVSENSDESQINPFDRSLFPSYPSVNVTSNDPITIYDPSSAGYDDRYPRISYSAVEASDESGAESETYRGIDNQPNAINQNSVGLNINNIDVKPEDIRKAADGSGLIRRSADSSSTTATERVQRQASTRPVKVTTPDGRRLFYRDSHSMEPHEHYYYGPSHDHDSETRYYSRPRQTHDHDSETRYYNRPAQTHDHDSERRYYRTYYRPRQTHDHDNERRYYQTYYRPRQTHDHDAERRYRQTHDHDAERYNYYQRVYRNGRALYIDRHSKVPHAHTSDAYRNDHDHQHSDVHLYARYRNSDIPATAKPNQLQYIPSDRYHDKDYYWTYS